MSGLSGFDLTDRKPPGEGAGMEEILAVQPPSSDRRGIVQVERDRVLAFPVSSLETGVRCLGPQRARARSSCWELCWSWLSL